MNVDLDLGTVANGHFKVVMDASAHFPSPVRRDPNLIYCISGRELETIRGICQPNSSKTARSRVSTRFEFREFIGRACGVDETSVWAVSLQRGGSRTADEGG